MKSIKYIYLLVLIQLIAGCSDSNNILESDNFPYKKDNIILQYIEKAPSKTKNYSIDLSTMQSPFLEIGKYKRIESRILMKFTGFPDDVNIIEAYLRLYPYYIYGEGKPEFNAKIYKILSDWDGFSYNDISHSFTEYGSFNVQNNLQPDSVFIGEDLIQNWINQENDSLIFGFMIDFDNAEFIKEYYSVNAENDKVPILYLKYLQNEQVRDTVMIPNTDLFLTKFEKPDTTEEYIVNNTPGYRAVLFFDLTDIPKYSVVNKAILHFDVDYNASLLKQTEDEYIAASPLTDSQWDSVKYNNNAVRKGKFTQSGLDIPVREFVRDWVSGYNENNGILVLSNSEGIDVRYYRLLKVAGDSLSSPRLNIYYSVPPKKHFEQ